MRIIDKSPLVAEDGSISLFNRLRGTLQYGNTWFRDMQAQEEAIRALSPALDNRYTLLRNVTLPDAGIPVPMTLVGPNGIWVLYVSGLRGVYRTKNDTWARMDSGHFKPVKPNLIRRVQLLARALQVYLEKQGLHNLPEVQGALLFTDPAHHVDTINPAVRVVLSDALERFAISITRQGETLTPQQIEGVVAAFNVGPQEELSDEDDAFALREADEEIPIPRLASPAKVRPANDFLSRINLTSKQWMLLGGMFAAEVVILFLFVLLLMFR